MNMMGLIKDKNKNRIIFKYLNNFKVDCSWVLPLVKPDNIMILGVKSSSDNIDIIVAQTNGRLVGVHPGVRGQRIANIIQLRLKLY